VVEVDVGQDEMAEVGELEPAGGESRLERVEARGRPAVEEGRLLAREQVRRDDLGVSQVEEVECLDSPT
jgi:hypothetical protein